MEYNQRSLQQMVQVSTTVQTNKWFNIICSSKYTVSWNGKETKMFFCNIFYQTQAILMKFGRQFPE